VEFPDYWLTNINPFSDISYDIHFGGRVIKYSDKGGVERICWEPAESVVAVAYDSPIDTFNTINLVLGGPYE
jgi:starch phosphorylase